MMIYNNYNFGLEYDINKLTVDKKTLLKIMKLFYI